MKQTILLCSLLAFSLHPLFAQKPAAISPGFTTEKFLEKDHKESYSIRLNKGEFFTMDLMQKGVDAVIDLFGPDGKKMKSFDSPNGPEGPEIVAFEAPENGIYRLDVHPFDNPEGYSASDFAQMVEKNQGNFAILSITVLSAKEYSEVLAREKKKQENIIRWITEHSITLSGVTAGSGFADLQPLKQVLADVQFVGLGEATHGTREFFQFKHRMLEFLVAEMGFTVFAIEASYAGCRNINDYVLYGTGDAHTALASQGFWTWDTEEVIDLIEWMRTYNLSVPDDKKVRFKGFDIQVNTKGGGVREIKDYLGKVDSVRCKEVCPLLDSIESISDSLQQRSAARAYDKFLAFFVASRGIYIQRSSEAAYERALACVRILRQLIDAYFMDAKDPRKTEREWRDYYMAGNFFDLVRQEKPGTKMVLWAHNGHISFNSGGMVNGGFKPFGSYLREAYGNNYYAFGFLFNQGGFQSMEVDSTGKLKGLQEFTVKPAKEGSLDWYFAQTRKPACILNLREKGMPDYMQEFENRTFDTRNYGSMANRRYYDQMYGTITPHAEFDGLIYIDETHRSRATERGTRKEKK